MVLHEKTKPKIKDYKNEKNTSSKTQNVYLTKAQRKLSQLKEENAYESTRSLQTPKFYLPQSNQNKIYRIKKGY